MNNTRWGWLAGLCLVLTACGGGDSTPQTYLTADTTAVTRESGLDATGPVGSVTVIAHDPPVADLWADFSYSSNGIQSVTMTNASDWSLTVQIQFKPGAMLGAGTYVDAVEVRVCYDEACASQVGNSPVTINTSYTVIGS